jgi:putative Holliday junction resolvase
MAHPAETLEPRSLEDLLQRLTALATSRGSVAVALGLPMNMDGTEGESAAAVRELGRRLESKGLTVHLWDERLTSWEAAGRMKAIGRRVRSKGVVDRAAAAILLQSFLDHRRGRAQ